jgi:hypothetical protein
MKHQVHLGTKSGIVSREAAQIRMLIDDLVHTVDVLDAGGAADLPRADDAIDLDTRRHNLMVTVASLEDRLGSIENMRSREDRAQVNSTLPSRSRRTGLTERVLRLEPRLWRPAAIGRVEPLRHDALKAHAAGMVKHRRAIVRQMLVEQDRVLDLAEQLGELPLRSNSGTSRKSSP